MKKDIANTLSEKTTTQNINEIIEKLKKTKITKKNYRSKYEISFKGTVTNLFCAARYRAKKHKLEINLDREWIEQRLSKMKCEATGVDLVLEIRDDVFHSPFRPSVDRINNEKGYTKDNCQIVCVIFNKAKSDYATEDVIKMSKGLLEICNKNQKNT